MTKMNYVEGLPSLDLQGVASYIRNGHAKKIIVLSGAGISTAAGIPDFRSPDTGIYDNVQKYNLPSPESLFEINFFRDNPKPFFDFSKEFLKCDYKPTPAHFLSSLFQQKGILKRVYTQNIDSLDRKVGISDELLIEAHGHYESAHCLSCKKEYKLNEIKSDLLTGEILYCKNENCKGIIKPDVVFYNEDLPEDFYDQLESDFEDCDLLIVIGTCLKVEPFGAIIEYVPRNIPRVLINREMVKTYNEDPIVVNGKIIDKSPERLSQLFKFGHILNRRDIFLGGDCQESVIRLVNEIGWKDEFDLLQKKCAK
ncbi:NAD-dependent protein deacetylase Sirt2 [Tritrichomonas foetus]|uniref:NAD-dependent protein deacetylase Sirt2 n=1 Tax=Tritrichomonas foetus TaxID=1144522 RepID=A0A1J4J4V7_9EUKA|nr:NAD-dependent protein deacetylase Sirt2 [Tritrichomonas foetus]|eukprot:OHS94354.1 NAD-dependent protein deacetylase Sirt2 [Tritrichomonas foetus]